MDTVFPVEARSCGPKSFILSNLDDYLSTYCYFDIIICGDPNRYNTHFVCNQLDLGNLVTEPTRGAALLDFFLISRNISSNYVVSVILPVSNSDHSSVNAIPKSGSHAVLRPLYDFRKFNISNFVTYGILSFLEYRKIEDWNEI